MRRLATLFVLLLAAAGVAATQIPWPRPLLAARFATPPRADSIKAWGLQLQNVLPLAIPEGIDLLVVDYSRDGSDAAAWTPARVEALRRGAGGGPRKRLVLCYLSIGEAESYRYYWRRRWETAPPAWLGPENTGWKGNFHVRYWMPEWQRLIFDPEPTVASRLLERAGLRAKPYLDRIIEAGFDGVYLDRIDAFGDWQKERTEETAEAEMAAFVRAIADTARARKPGFLIVPQNGEELLAKPDYVQAIDATAKEDLFHGIDGDDKTNDADAVSATMKLLDKARAAGKPVLVVEYLADTPRRAEIAAAIRAKGYVPLFANRALNEPPQLVPANAALQVAPAAIPPQAGQPPTPAQKPADASAQPR